MNQCHSCSKDIKKVSSFHQWVGSHRFKSHQLQGMILYISLLELQVLCLEKSQVWVSPVAASATLPANYPRNDFVDYVFRDAILRFSTFTRWWTLCFLWLLDIGKWSYGRIFSQSYWTLIQATITSSYCRTWGSHSKIICNQIHSWLKSWSSCLWSKNLPCVLLSHYCSLYLLQW